MGSLHMHDKVPWCAGGHRTRTDAFRQPGMTRQELTPAPCAGRTQVGLTLVWHGVRAGVPVGRARCAGRRRQLAAAEADERARAARSVRPAVGPLARRRAVHCTRRPAGMQSRVLPDHMLGAPCSL